MMIVLAVTSTTLYQFVSDQADELEDLFEIYRKNPKKIT